MAPVIQVNRAGRSANMIQHTMRQTIIEHFLIYIYVSGKSDTVDVSYHMQYSGPGTMLHLKQNILTYDTFSSTNVA